jgi:hypothetical protein
MGGSRVLRVKVLHKSRVENVGLVLPCSLALSIAEPLHKELAAGAPARHKAHVDEALDRVRPR